LTILAAIIDGKTLGETIVYALAAGVGISVTFGAGVASVANLVDARRDGRQVATVAWAALAGVCVVCALAAVVLGVVVMTEKG
jgi:ABC-type nickel/cobalt efflux system permease component RcnA